MAGLIGDDWRQNQQYNQHFFHFPTRRAENWMKSSRNREHSGNRTSSAFVVFSLRFCQRWASNDGRKHIFEMLNRRGKCQKKTRKQKKRRKQHCNCFRPFNKRPFQPFRWSSFHSMKLWHIWCVSVTVCATQRDNVQFVFCDGAFLGQDWYGVAKAIGVVHATDIEEIIQLTQNAHQRVEDDAVQSVRVVDNRIFAENRSENAESTSVPVDRWWKGEWGRNGNHMRKLENHPSKSNGKRSQIGLSH